MKKTKVLLLLSIVSVLGSCVQNNTSNTGKPTYTPSSITDNSTKEPEVVNVESVSITNKINTLNLGDDYDIAYEVLPANATNKKVSFSSSKPDVVSVDRSTGKLTANASGTATITVKTEDGDKTDSFDVLVPVAVTGINIALNASSVYVGDEVDFTVSVLPEDATDKSYELTTTTVDLLSIEGKKVTAIKEGHASLTAKTGSIEKTINFDVKKPIESAEFDEIKTVLETALIKEKTNSNGGSWKHKKLDLTTEEKQYDWTVYTDSIQKRITSSEGEYVDDLAFIQANSDSKNYLHNIIDTTSQTEANNKVKETKKSVGNGFSDVLNQDQANNAISMISEDTDYSGSSVYGISQYALNYLTETSSKGLSNDNSKEKAVVRKIDNLDNNFVYKIESKFEGDTSYYNEISFEIGLSGDKLISFKFDQKVYNSNGYDFTAHALKTDAIPYQTAVDDATLNYGTRVDSDENKLDKDDYKIKAFTIQSIGDNNQIDLNYNDGVAFDLKTTITTPNKYLDESFTYQSSDSNVISVSTISKKLMVKGAGTATITMTYENGAFATTDITVVSHPVTSISITNTTKELYVGDTLNLTVQVNPDNANTKEYTIEVIEGSDVATLKLNSDGSYTLVGKKAGIIKVQAKAKDNDTLSEVVEFTVKEKPAADLSTVKANIVGYGPYSYKYGDISFDFKNDGTAKLEFYKGRIYTLNWDISVNSDGTYELSMKSIQQQDGTSGNDRINSASSGYFSKDLKKFYLTYSSDSGWGWEEATATLTAENYQ